jgi:hypothetical protein
MTKTNSPDEHEHHGLGQRIRERILAAEVAAEEAAEFGPGTAALEATEAAVDPEREAGAAPAEDKAKPSAD